MNKPRFKIGDYIYTDYKLTYPSDSIKQISEITNITEKLVDGQIFYTYKYKLIKRFKNALRLHLDKFTQGSEFCSNTVKIGKDTKAVEILFGDIGE